eukprot:CAMPEP_0176059298 /NCGR_PEP_ID=MMETSP0120_2-20121206/29551_1 /TAXON_ID=160619 /ORGANISM="Kryptoperidinium foliaceum, Strain CCMP 1326" /LENGTH=279 /DNA_ID=CAMNT_0017392835 /DNA_START=102 /DNA_END=941 /DNA_ORIENTATION=-
MAALIASTWDGLGVAAVNVLARGRLSASALSGEWRGCMEAEAEDERFWASEWSELEAELLQIEVAANITAAAAVGKAPEHKEHARSPLAGLKLNLEPKSPADLVPALAMLKGLYEDGKERISKLNVREKESKRKFEEKQVAHAKRMQEIEDNFKNHKLSAEFRTNETHDENRFWSYWERVRERQHRQFHTSLKIQHGTLEKVKQMIDMYEKTIAGKADKVQVAKQLGMVGGGMPEVVFLQAASRALASYCHEALLEVRSERQALLLQISEKGAPVGEEA